MNGEMMVCRPQAKNLIIRYNAVMTEMQNNYSLNHGEVISLLKEYGISPTRQRVEIARFLFQKPQHLSAENILGSVNAQGHGVSRATVYNTMGLFADKGLVREVLIDRERVFYDSNNSQHHHIYNVDSGELSDLKVDLTEKMNIPELPDNVSIVNTDVIVRVSSK